MYSKKATIGFFMITAVLVSVFSLVSQDTGLFKGSLFSNNKGLIIDYPEIVDGTLCPQDTSISPSEDLHLFPKCTANNFILDTTFEAKDSTIIIQNPDTQTVVAVYSIDFLPGAKNTIPFDGSTCGVYKFNVGTSTYEKVDNLVCPAGVYEFVVTGNSTEQGLFAEAVKFALTK